ncbi:MAG: hypothetical protein WCZ90_02880 [Melioribacteraceae bacterium]
MNSYKNKLKLFGSIVFVYVMLFEFILPMNKLLPKPTILFESFLHVWQDYGLLAGIMITAGTVYFAIGLSLLLLWSLRGTIIKLLLEQKVIFELLQLFKTIPVFILIVLTAFWFDGSELAKVIFIFVVTMISLTRVLAKEIFQTKSEYLDIAKNLNPSKLYSDVYWNSSLPGLLNLAERFQRILWLIVLSYEFVSVSFGIGTILRLALLYKDFGAIIVIAIILTMLIWCGTLVIKFIKKKIAFWES